MKICLCFFLGWCTLVQAIVIPTPCHVILNEDTTYSLVNSVDFHPSENIFCAAFTHNNKVCLYKIDSDQKVHLIQCLTSPSAGLREPQHAVFSPDGEKIVVANWTDRSLSIYKRKEDGLFSERPITRIYTPIVFLHSKPHGIAFSPCGMYLAVAFGATHDFKNGIGLFKKRGTLLKCSSFLTHSNLPGTPKGICFTPDSTHLLVTFCDPDALHMFPIQNGIVQSTPTQIISGLHTQLSRPEDVKISPDHTYCAVTNSDQNSVTFYRFNKDLNLISESAPFWILQNPEANFAFPHGLAFSSDGTYLAITQFGHIEMNQEGKIIWDANLPPQEGTIQLYQIP